MNFQKGKIDLSAISVEKLQLPLLEEKNVEIFVLRLDKIHPVISGNKWFKLRNYLQEAIDAGKKTIVTRGGAWSNHIIATAAACHEFGLRSIGIIRGEEPARLSHTLLEAKKLSMELVFMNRDDYRKNHLPEPVKNDDYYFINEGGYGMPGMLGAAAILDHCNLKDLTHIAAALGTTTTMAGLIHASAGKQHVLGISVLKNLNRADDAIKNMVENKPCNYSINHDYHFGGYAKLNDSLFRFMNRFYDLSGIPTDFVYTGKLFFAIIDLVEKNYFVPGNRVLVIHSGGLQGNASLNKGTLIF